MNDAELGKALGFTEAETAIAVPKLTPEKRAAYERLIKLGDDLNLWMAGVGEKPQGVLTDTERSTKRRRAWR